MADSWQLSELSDSPRAWPLVLTYMCFFKTHVFFLLLFVCFKGSPPKKEKHIEVSMSNTWIRPNLSGRKKKHRKIGGKTLGDWNIMGICNHLQDASEGGNGQWTRSQTHCLLRNFRGGPPWLGANGEFNEFPMFFWILCFEKTNLQWWFHWGQAGKSAGLEDLICDFLILLMFVLRFFWR